MPQIAKGGKYIFGWSMVGADGSIQIPIEAQDEYQFIPGDNLFLLSGSKSTGGFVISTKALIQNSKMAEIIFNNPELSHYEVSEGTTIEYKHRILCWVNLKAGGIFSLPEMTLSAYGVKQGDRLLAIRGSYVGLTMGVRGPIIEAAKTHPEIQVF